MSWLLLIAAGYLLHKYQDRILAKLVSLFK